MRLFPIDLLIYHAKLNLEMIERLEFDKKSGKFKVFYFKLSS